MIEFASAWAELAKAERARHHKVWGTHIEPSLPNFRQNGELSPKAQTIRDMLDDADDEVTTDDLIAAVGLHRSTVHKLLRGLGAECRVGHDGTKKQGYWRLRDAD